MFKIIALIFCITLFTSCQDSKLNERINKLESKVDSLERVYQPYKPGLGTLMNSIQSHHMKLWNAGNNENWELVKFELHELEERFEDVEKYHKANDEAKQVAMIFPQIENLENAAKNKSKAQFLESFATLTATCNSCHQLNEHPFIKIIVPKGGEGNQDFSVEK